MFSFWFRFCFFFFFGPETIIKIIINICMCVCVLELQIFTSVKCFSFRFLLFFLLFHFSWEIINSGIGNKNYIFFLPFKKNEHSHHFHLFRVILFFLFQMSSSETKQKKIDQSKFVQSLLMFNDDFWKRILIFKNQTKKREIKRKLSIMATEFFFVKWKSSQFFHSLLIAVNWISSYGRI